MENFKVITLLVGLILILFAYLRFISDESGNVHKKTKNRFLALIMYLGILFVYLGV